MLRFFTHFYIVSALWNTLSFTMLLWFSFGTSESKWLSDVEMHQDTSNNDGKII